MKKEKDLFSQFHNSFSHLEGHLHILEQQVPVEVQMDYFKYSEVLRRRGLELHPTDEALDDLVEQLQAPETAVQHKKHILSTLAISKSVKVYRVLETYVKEPDESVANWAYMALMESRIALESEFSDEKQIYISTGMGGKEGKLRFFALFTSTNHLPFQDYQRGIIEREFPYLLSHEGCVVERLTVAMNYVEMTFLVPVRSDIKGILEKIINECNQYGDFLSRTFTITNVKELSESEIADIINEYGND